MSNTLSKKKEILKRIYVILIVIVAIVLMAFPTPHSRTRQESYIEYETVTKTDLEVTYGCSGTLKDGYYWDWSRSDLPSGLKIVVDVSSTETLEIRIKSVSDNVIKTLKEHYYTVITEGPSLYINIQNPTLLYLGTTAVISGDIKVYHEYEAQVPVTKYQTVPYEQWLPWWMP